MSKEVKAEEWGPRCCLEGTLRAALHLVGTRRCPAGRRGLDRNFPRGADPTSMGPGSSLRSFEGILGPERIGIYLLR